MTSINTTQCDYTYIIFFYTRIIQIKRYYSFLASLPKRISIELHNMVHEVTCMTSSYLSLGDHELPSNHVLNLHDQDQDQDQYQQSLENKYLVEVDQSLPSLTLGLGRDQDPVSLIRQASNSITSPVSSFSNSTSSKRERGGDIEEVEKVLLSKATNYIDHVELEGGERKKLRLTQEQSFVLEESFKQHNTLNPKQKQSLATHLNLRPRQVEVWFQNRRARTKLKQSEVNCALLKKCCETLTSDNMRLKKEIQQLKATTTTNVPSQFYMQFPADTHNMCPSCERIVSSSSNDGGGMAKRVLSRSPKSRSHPFSQLR
ncbi:Homeobox, conserved site-containing protein [Artemisia annua]|uniref:Homeobox, conserved site-containing protein n=1 Tax=Artemisia annua TaxID=35608 RepID=A0A2U1P8V0_ARTAN|nr:Homeobox, conserved site-containing protein [Artemisia annua]